MVRTKQTSRCRTKSGKPATFPGGGGLALGTSGDNVLSNLGGWKGTPGMSTT